MEQLDFCRFCNIITNYSMGQIANNLSPIYDTVLYNTDNFLAVPALGALVPGYIMIMSKKHINSMAYLSEKEMAELINSVEYLKAILLKNFGILPILFEHGSAVGSSNKSACCVEHAHWHLAPLRLSSSAEVIQNTKAIKISDLQSIRTFKDKPYLLYVNNKGDIYISCDTILPSQYMRKWMAAEIGRPKEWDWRLYEFKDNITSTITVFKSQVNQII